MRSPKTILPIMALAMATMISPAFADSTEAHKSGVIYNSVITPLPGNLVSQAFEAQQVSEFGNAVIFSSGKNHELSKVIVTMSSWGCEFGTRSGGTCQTSKGASFTVPITLNIYAPSTDGVNPGIRLGSTTETFSINFRPSTSSQCFEGRWYDKDAKRCYNGLAQNITFNLKDLEVGSSAIFGIAYNTTHYGYAPIGENAPCFVTTAGCGYDSLNVALTEDPTNVKIGRSVIPGKPWLASTYAGMYADDGAAGLGTFRMDSPKVPAWWGAGDSWTTAPWFVPAIKVFANQGGVDENQSDEKSTTNKQSDSKSEGKRGIKQS